MDFQNSRLFGISACFYLTITRNVESFQYFNFEKQFVKNKNFLKKLEHRFLVESTKIENAIFLYKTAWSVANVKAKRMGSAKFEKFVSVYEPLTKS